MIWLILYKGELVGQTVTAIYRVQVRLAFQFLLKLSFKPTFVKLYNTCVEVGVHVLSMIKCMQIL